MFRKRLLGLFTAALLAMSAGPAAALGTATLADDVADVAEAVETAATTGDVMAPVDVVAQKAQEGPIIDEGIDGLGHLTIEVDEEDMSLTVAVEVEPLGIDESVTMGMPGGDEAPADESLEPTPAEVAQAEAKHELTGQKAEAAADRSAPAFSAVADLENASGSVDSGVGASASRRPVVAAAEGDNASADAIIDAVQNPWLRLMAVVLLAGTGTAWSIARRLNLA